MLVGPSFAANHDVTVATLAALAGGKFGVIPVVWNNPFCRLGSCGLIPLKNACVVGGGVGSEVETARGAVEGLRARIPNPHPVLGAGVGRV